MDILTWIIVTIFVCSIVYLLGMFIWIGLGLDDKYKVLEKKTKDMNLPYKCRCGIVSRKYQLLQELNLICPHCSYRMMEYGDRIEETREFPFAPKMSMKEVNLYLKDKKKMEKVESELQKLKEYDKEIEAWEKIQLKKLKELEERANKIKAEMKLKEEYHV